MSIHALISAILFSLVLLSSRTSVAAADPDICDRAEIESLQEQLLCQESKSPSTCGAVGLAVAGSVSTVRFKRLTNAGSHTVNEERLAINKEVLKQVQKVSAKAQREAREFARTLAEVMAEQQHTGEPLKIRGFSAMNGGKPTWSQLYSTFKDQINARIPDNEVAKKMRTGVTPENFISSSIRAVASETSKDLESWQKASYQKYTELEQLRFSEYFDRMQSKLGVQISLHRMPVYAVRSETARELRNSRQALAAFDALSVSSCGRFMRSAAVAVGIAPLTQFAVGATAWTRVENCASDFKTALTEQDKMFLIEAEQNNLGASAGMSCDQFDISSQSLDKFLVAKPGTYSAGLQHFLCSLEKKKLQKKVSAFDASPETTIDCNHIELPGSTTTLVGSNLQIALKSGGVVSIPLREDSSWDYGAIRSSKASLQDILIQKVRHPMVSSSAKRQVLTPEYSCATEGVANRNGDLCETSRALEAWNHFAPLAQNECQAQN